MKVSVIIPNYNGKELLRVCLSSLCKQSLVPFEIIVVDNNSEDGSCEFVKENYPQVKLIQLAQNSGFSRAVNTGIRAARGEYIALVNNDTEAEVNWLESLVHCLKKDERIFSCASKMIQYHHRDKIDDAGDEYMLPGWTHKCGNGLPAERYNKNREIFSSCAGAALYRKEVFTEIGYFDEQFFAYLEDIDVSYRARIYGYKNIFCSNAVIYHRGSATTGSRYNSTKVFLTARNNIYLIYKNMPCLQVLINSPFLVLGWGIKFLFFWQKGLAGDYLQGTAEGLRGARALEKTPFRLARLGNYIRIEIQLIKSTFNYIPERLFRE